MYDINTIKNINNPNYKGKTILHNQPDKPERGSASFTADLEDSVITISHGSCGIVLAKWDAKLGDWNKLWNIINKLVKHNDGYRV